MDRSEGEIQKEIIDHLKLRGGLVFRMNSGSTKNNVKLAPKGTPDLLAIMINKVLWIEVKTATGKPNKDQINMHIVLKTMGQKVIIARSLDDVIEALK